MSELSKEQIEDLKFETNVYYHMLGEQRLYRDRCLHPEAWWPDDPEMCDRMRISPEEFDRAVKERRRPIPEKELYAALVAKVAEMRAEEAAASRPVKFSVAAPRVGPEPLAVRARVRQTYYIRRSVDGMVKIGKSFHPVARMGQLRQGGHMELLAVEPLDVERTRHRQFEHLREFGEWFRPGPELMAHIESLAQEPGHD